MFTEAYRKKLAIWETDWGRDSGWFIELDGETLARLTEPRWEEMFWVSYRMEIMTDDSGIREQLKTEQFWTEQFWDYAEDERPVWRNIRFGDVAEGVFPAGTPFPEPGRLTVRCLYLPLREPSIIDWGVLRFRKLFRIKIVEQAVPPKSDRAGG